MLHRYGHTYSKNAYIHTYAQKNRKETEYKKRLYTHVPKSFNYFSYKKLHKNYIRTYIRIVKRIAYVNTYLKKLHYYLHTRTKKITDEKKEKKFGFIRKKIAFSRFSRASLSNLRVQSNVQLSTCTSSVAIYRRKNLKCLKTRR